MSSTRAAFCSTIRTVRLRSSFSRRMMVKISSTMSGASPSEGSSSRIAFGAEDAGDSLKRRGLAGSVGAEQGRDPAWLGAQRHAAQHEDHVVVDDFDVVEREHGGLKQSGRHHLDAGRLGGMRYSAAATA